MSEFNNQAEVWQALLDGKTVEHIDSKYLYKMLNGSLVRKFGDGSFSPTERTFKYFNEYVVYGEPNKKKTTIFAPAVYKDSFGIYCLSEELYPSLELAKNTFGDRFCSWLNVEMPIKIEEDE